MRKIALVTTSRADYGIQSRLIKKLASDRDIDFKLIVTGSHCCQKYGLTYQEIEKNGVYIDYKVDIGMDFFDNIEDVMAKALTETSKVLKKESPDIVVLLGDRYEMLSVAMACVINNIPIAHLHGGETTEGATDEVFRHSITKASYLHFTTCEAYRNRVIQLGESPERVFNVGALGVENTHHVDLMTKEELENSLNLKWQNKNLLVTFHSVTFEKGMAEKQINELIDALSELKDTTIIITGSNADAEGNIIQKRIDNFVKNNKNVYFYNSLGNSRYLSVVNIVDAVVGNSSSGIIEVPSFNTATINIGNRQTGRIQSTSVINCEPNKGSILQAINQVYTDDFQNILEHHVNPYDKKDTADRILEILKNADLSNALKKKFWDIKENIFSENNYEKN